MTRALALALLILVAQAGAVLAISPAERALLFKKKPHTPPGPPSSGALLKTDGVSYLLLVAGGKILRVE